jgi:hypothetical protein
MALPASKAFKAPPKAPGSISPLGTSIDKA